MIRNLTIKDLDTVAHLADQFYASSQFLERFNLDIFKRTWASFFNSGTGIIFGLVDEQTGEIYGGIGGCKYADPNNGEMIAAEFFWYVDKDRRGEGIALLNRFESWAKEQGCRIVQMVHLCDLMPEVVKRIYDMRGYRAVEIAYRKEV